MQVQQFVERIAAARKRAKITYHTGALALDRSQGMDTLMIDAVAKAAWAAYEAGKVTLVQRSVLPGIHEYIAEVL